MKIVKSAFGTLREIGAGVRQDVRTNVREYARNI